METFTHARANFLPAASFLSIRWGNVGEKVNVPSAINRRWLNPRGSRFACRTDSIGLRNNGRVSPISRRIVADRFEFESHTHTHDRVSRLWPNIPSFLQVGGNCYTRVTINSDDVGSRERVQHDGFLWCFIFHRVESRIERRSDRVATKVNKLCFHIISTALTSNHMQIPCVLYIFCIHLSVKAVYESRDFCR